MYNLICVENNITAVMWHHFPTEQCSTPSPLWYAKFAVGLRLTGPGTDSSFPGPIPMWLLVVCLGKGATLRILVWMCGFNWYYHSIITPSEHLTITELQLIIASQMGKVFILVIIIFSDIPFPLIYCFCSIFWSYTGNYQKAPHIHIWVCVYTCTHDRS